MPPLILLPPSEKKAPGGVGVPWHEAGQSFAGLDAARREVIAALDDAMGAPPEARARLLGVSAANVDRATIANRCVDTAPTLPAIVRYTGVLYDALDAESLSALLRKRLDEQVVIFSGLWGALRPSDPVPDYKLKMGASLPGLGRPSRYWKPHLTKALAEADSATVWDLLPNEHTAAWHPSVARNRIRVRFLDDVERDGRRTLITVSHWNKLLKGALVRHLLEHRLDDPDGLAGFDHPEGYAYRPDLTTTSGNTTDIALVALR